MTHYSFIDEYNALFVKFVKFISSKEYDRCLIGMDGKDFRFDLQIFLQSDSNLMEELKNWPEWIQLDQKVQDNGGKSLNHYYVLGHQFSDLLNSIHFVKTHTTPKFGRLLPHLRNIVNDYEVFNNTLLNGEMSFVGVMQNRYVILIQGLKVSQKIEFGDLGYLDAIPVHLKDSPQFWFGHFPSHLYTAFYTSNENVLTDSFLCRFMTALRTYEDKDIRFDSILTESTDVIGKPSYSNYHGVSYREDTALFGTESPCLLAISKSDICQFADHVKIMIKGLTNMDICCEYYNYSRICPNHLQIPTAFIAIESIFPSTNKQKQNTLAKIFRFILNEDRKFGELIKKYYRLRNNIVHGNKAGQCKIRSEIGKEHKNAPHLHEILRIALIELANRHWHPSKDIENLISSIDN